MPSPDYCCARSWPTNNGCDRPRKRRSGIRSKSSPRCRGNRRRRNNRISGRTKWCRSVECHLRRLLNQLPPISARDFNRAWQQAAIAAKKMRFARHLMPSTNETRKSADDGTNRNSLAIEQSRQDLSQPLDDEAVLRRLRTRLAADGIVG